MLTLSFAALVTSFACAFAYSASDFFRKAVPATCGVTLTLFYGFGMELPVLAGWLWISGDNRIGGGYLMPGLAAAVIGTGANVLFLTALRRSPLSLMIPLLALVPVLTLLVGGVLLAEWPTLVQAAGIVLVVAGLLMLYTPPGTYGPLAAWRGLIRERGAGPMIGVVLLWSVSPPVDKLCLEHASIAVHGMVQLAILLVVTGAWLAARGGLRAFMVPPGAALPLTGAALTAGVGYVLQLAAYQMTLVAVVELFKRMIGLVSAMVLGRTFFKETVTGTKVVAIGVMILGLPLVLLG